MKSQTESGTEKKQWPIVELNSVRGVWSNERAPKIGDKVQITFNGLGKGTIIESFLEAGYLGVLVMPDAGQRPQWHIDQFKRNGAQFKGYHVFGAEIKFLASDANCARQGCAVSYPHASHA